MPPKAKITKEMIIEAAFEIVRENGIENVNVRNIAKRLNCSTQPVMYHFAAIEELKQVLYKEADRFQTEYLMNIKSEEIMLEIGLNYIRFAVDEPMLFRFLFQSGYAVSNSMLELADNEEAAPLVALMQQAMELDEKSTKEVFVTLALFAHGYASIIANTPMEFDEKTAAEQLERVYNGALLAAKEDLK